MLSDTDGSSSSAFGSTGTDSTELDGTGSGEETGAALGSCGDGVVDPSEQCDEGAANGPGEHCKENCTTNVCGDGDQGPAEACDDGNLVEGDGCNADCRIESCGNAILDAGEACDDGANGNQDDGCTDLCTEPTCGDGFVQPSLGEQCDDANANNDDACVVGCKSASCGDGYTWSGVEACDDGNADNTDGCLVGCVAATCGDGHVWTNVEDCDDDNTEAGDGCSETCNEEDGWSCDSNSCVEICGDGIVAGKECCDDGNTNDGDDCPSNCQLTHRWVFVTSQLYRGNDLGGVSSGDSQCQALAVSAGLPGIYRAWLSDGDESPSTRFESTPGCAIPYRLVDNTQIASDWNDLTDGTIANPINVDELGDTNATSYVWTGTESDGTAAADHCEGWTSYQYGQSGRSAITASGWSSSSLRNCGYDAPLYCFQQ